MSGDRGQHLRRRRLQALEAIDVDSGPLGQGLVHQGFEDAFGKLREKGRGHLREACLAIEGAGVDALGQSRE